MRDDLNDLNDRRRPTADSGGSAVAIDAADRAIDSAAIGEALSDPVRRPIGGTEIVQ